MKESNHEGERTEQPPPHTNLLAAPINPIDNLEGTPQPWSSRGPFGDPFANNPATKSIPAQVKQIHRSNKWSRSIDDTALGQPISSLQQSDQNDLRSEVGRRTFGETLSRARFDEMSPTIISIQDPTSAVSLDGAQDALLKVEDAVDRHLTDLSLAIRSVEVPSSHEINHPALLRVEITMDRRLPDFSLRLRRIAPDEPGPRRSSTTRSLASMGARMGHDGPNVLAWSQDVELQTSMAPDDLENPSIAGGENHGPGGSDTMYPMTVVA